MPKKIFVYLLSIITIISYISLFYVSAGTTAPVTTAVPNPLLPNGNLGWYVTPVTITLTSSDLESGVAEIRYKLNSGEWKTVYFENTLNLLSNPSFELTDLTSDINTMDWNSNGLVPEVAYSRDTINYAPGYQSTSIKIESTDVNWHSINNLGSFAVTIPYKNMNSSAWIKTENVVGNVYYKIYAVSQDLLGIPVYTLISQSSSLSGTADWTLLSTNYVVNVDGAMGVYMDIGIEGTGTVWFDAVNINDSVVNTSTVTTIGSDGNHTLSYYAVDRSGNIEATKTLSLKIDQTPPGNWRNSGAIRGFFGSDYQLWVYAEVDDPTSGISTFTDKYQYNTEVRPGFGRYSNILSCGSTWNEDDWVILISPPFFPGVKSAYLITPKTSFCNSNWNVCKTVRFFAQDLAGNFSTKDFCINGPWIKVRDKGIVFGNLGVDMLSEAKGDNTDGLVEVTNNQIDFFTSSQDWYIKFSLGPNFYSYDSLWEMTSNRTEITTNLSGSSGVYYKNGDMTIESSNLPGGFSSATFTQIVFIDGDLTIETDMEIGDSSALLFIVNGDVNIAKAVTDIEVAIFAESIIYTAYDIVEGDSTETLNLRGVFSADRFIFQRTLQGTDNNNAASEEFYYEPKYVTKINDYLGTSAVKWIGSE